MPFRWSEEYRRDQEARRLVNQHTVYTETARCVWCGDRLNGRTSGCTICGSLLCPIHSCVDGRCPEHANPSELAF